MKRNHVDVIEAGQLWYRVKERNDEGWTLVGAITSCFLDGGHTYFICSWEKEWKEQ